jgi:hypothetical protein
VTYSTTLAAVLVLLTAVFATAAPRQPDDVAILRHLYREVAAHGGIDTEPFASQFWSESGRIARARGPQILHALFREARGWRDEEIIAYLPLIIQLDRRQTLDILRRYEQYDPRSRELVSYLRGELRQYDDSHRK